MGRVFDLKGGPIYDKPVNSRKASGCIPSPAITSGDQGQLSIQIADQFNPVVENVKKEYPDAAPHLPQPITWTGIAAQDMQIADITFIDFEMLLNQVLAVLDVLRGSH
jgi:hypothetical protein